MHPKILALAILSAVFLTPVQGEDSIPPPSPEAVHYEYLREETRAFREFVEKEREEHRRFLESAYTISGIAIGIIAVVFTILGIRSIQDVKKLAKLEYELKIKNLLEDELASTEQKILALRRLVAQEEMLINASLRFIVPEKVVPSFKRDELAFFGGEKPQFDIGPLKEKEDFLKYNAIIYYFDPDETEEDENLQMLLKQLMGKFIPLIVYTHGLWIQKTTKKALDSYQFNSPANNIITLLNNTSDAFRLKLNSK